MLANKTIWLGTIAFLFLSSFPASASRRLSPGLNYDWVRDAGGLFVGSPIRHKNGVVELPVCINYCSEEALREHPSLTSMGMSVIEGQVAKKEIHVTVVTYLFKSARLQKRNSLNLGKIPSGEYKVFYYSPRLAPVFLSTVQVPDR